MIVEFYGNELLGTHWFITAPAVARDGYRPGRVNSVSVFRQQSGWELQYTDGYRTQLLGWATSRLKALALAARAICDGAGGGFQSRYAAGV